MRAKDVTRSGITVVELHKKRIPRDQGGDPHFTTLRELQEVFTEDELVAVVNRYVYFTEYQKVYHRKRAAVERERDKAFKECFKRLYPGESFAKAREEQLREVVRALGDAKEEENK